LKLKLVSKMTVVYVGRHSGSGLRLPILAG